MILIVTGSRKGRIDVWRALNSFVETHGKPEWLIEGGASGVDYQAGRWARNKLVRFVTVPALWGRGKRAGHERNAAMATLAEALVLAEGLEVFVLAFPVGSSPGTRGMMELGKLRGFKVIEPAYESEVR